MRIMEPMARDDTIEINSPATIEGMRRAGLLAASTLQVVGRWVRAGHLDARAEPGRREVDPRARRHLRAARLSRFSEEHLHERQRRRLPRNPVGEGSAARRRHRERRRHAEARRLPRRHLDDVPRRRRRRRSRARSWTCARESLRIGIAEVAPGKHIGDIGAAIQEYAESHDCSVVREYCGHGINRIVPHEPERPALRERAATARRCGPG